MKWELIVQGDSPVTAGRRIPVVADSWFAALQAGLKVNEGLQTSVTGVTCSVRPDGSVFVRDYISRREYVLVPLSDDVAADAVLPRLEGNADAPLEDAIVLAFERMQEIFALRDHDDVAEFVLRTAGDLLPSEGSAFMLMRPGHNELYVAASSGSENAFVPQQSISISRGLLGFCIRNGAVVHVGMPADDGRFDGAMDWPFSCPLRNLLCVPVQHEGRTLGVLELYNSARKDGFSVSDINTGIYIAGAAAEYIERSLPHRDPAPRGKLSAAVQPDFVSKSARSSSRMG